MPSHPSQMCFSCYKTTPKKRGQHFIHTFTLECVRSPYYGQQGGLDDSMVLELERIRMHNLAKLLLQQLPCPGQLTGGADTGFTQENRKESGNSVRLTSGRVDSVRIPQAASLPSQCRKAISVTRSDITVSLSDAFPSAGCRAAFCKIHDWMRHMLPFKLVIEAPIPTSFHSEMLNTSSFLKEHKYLSYNIAVLKMSPNKDHSLKNRPSFRFQSLGAGEEYEA